MSNNDTKFSFSQKKPFMLIAAVILVVLVGIGLTKLMSIGADETVTSDFATFTVRKGPLRISVTESGTIKAREQVILKNEVEGRTSILTLVPEGNRVKKGDLLVELDASQLLDDKIDQEISVQNTEAAFISARENLAVVENQAQSDKDIAVLTLDFAGQDLRQYLEGEYPKQIKEAEAQIKLAEEEVAIAEEKLTWSSKLFKEKYISQTEKQADELAKKRKSLNLDLAKGDLDLLEKFTKQRNIKQLESDVKQAEMALERAKRKAKADVEQAKANFKARESEYNRQKSKLKKLKEQIVKTKIYAPADGLVIYATSAKRGGWRSSTEPLDEGQDVRERQELIYLPTGTTVKAEVDIHESNLKKVREGLPAVITVGEKSFVGTVANIAPLPDATSMWMNPDLKVYNTEIYIDGNDESLRSGTSCKVEIIVEQHEDAIYVPVQAVLRVEGETTVFVINKGETQKRTVETGLDNNRMIIITKGLEPGEIVSLTPPLKAAGVRLASDDVLSELTPAAENSKAIDIKINERLEKINGTGPADTEPKQKQRRKRFENLSPQEREKMRERSRNMSPEEREKMRRQRQQGGDR